MPIEWSGLAPELLLALDRRSGDPLHSRSAAKSCNASNSRRTGRRSAARDRSDVDVDVDGGVVRGRMMGAGDLRVDVPLGRRVDVGRSPPQPASFYAAAGNQPGQVMGDQDVIETVADPTALEGAGPRPRVKAGKGVDLDQRAVRIDQGGQVGSRLTQDGRALVEVAHHHDVAFPGG